MQASRSVTKKASMTWITASPLCRSVRLHLPNAGHPFFSRISAPPECLAPSRTNFPMSSGNSLDALSARPRKRRAINACVNCRTSKVRCDGNRPCQRCERINASCDYFDAVKDENLLRIEKLEREMQDLRQQLENYQSRSTPSSSLTPLNPYHPPSGHGAALTNAVEAGLTTWEQATTWFQRQVKSSISQSVKEHLYSLKLSMVIHFH